MTADWNSIRSREMLGGQKMRAIAVHYVPAMLLIFQSCFKEEVKHILSPANNYHAILVYGLLRVILWISFIYLVLRPRTELVGVERATPNIAGHAKHDPLLGMRGMACLLVLLGHYFMVVFAPSDPPVTVAGYIVSALAAGAPWAGVWTFFTLSGYLMGKGFFTGRHDVSRSGIIRFYRNRLLRIVPLYLIAALTISMLDHPELLDLSRADSLAAFFDLILFDQTAGGPGAIGALWSVSTEFQFYIISPLIALLIRYAFDNNITLVRVALIITLLMAIMKLIIIYHYPYLWQTKIYSPLLANIEPFFCGMATALLVNEARSRNFIMKNAMHWAYAAQLSFWLLISFWSYNEMRYFPGYPQSATSFIYLALAPAIVTLVISAMIFLFEVAPRASERRTLPWIVQALLGNLTYALYVWHEPIYIHLRTLLHVHLTFWTSIAYFPVAFGCVSAAAYICYFWLEKPIDGLRGINYPAKNSSLPFTQMRVPQ